MSLRILVFTFLTLGSINAMGANPNFLKLKVYKMAVSTSPLCTNLVTVIDNGSTATYADVLVNPTLGSGKLGKGTYPCVVIEFSDNIKYSSDATTGSCTANVEETLGVCGSGDSSTLIDGTTVSCTSGEDRIAMYLSTASTETTGTSGHTAFQSPTSLNDATKGFNLASALTVSGTATGKFVINGTGKINGSNSSCEMQPPLFSFSGI